MNIAALSAGLFSGIIGGMGLGGGAVLIIYLALFTQAEQLTAQGINLLFFIPTAVAATVIYTVKKQIKWGIVIRASIFGLMGTAVGWLAASSFGGELTSKIFGLFLTGFGIAEIIKSFRKNHNST